MNLETSRVEAYLSRRIGSAVQVLALQGLGGDTGAATDDERQLKA